MTKENNPARSVQRTKFGVTREHARGSRTIKSRAHFDGGGFETIHARRGPFRTQFEWYAVIVTATPSFGKLYLNGSRVQAPDHLDPRYSLLGPGDELAGSHAKDVVYDVLYIDPKFVDSILSVQPDAIDIHLASIVRAAPSATFTGLWRWIREIGNREDASALRIAEACIHLLVFYLAEPQVLLTKRPSRNGQHHALTRTITYIDENLTARLCLSEIAARAGLSPFHLCRVFRRATGLSIRKFIMERRLERARALLTLADESICQIAHDCGFSSQSHFTTRFRARFGTTPAAYRHATLPQKTAS